MPSSFLEREIEWRLAHSLTILWDLFETKISLIKKKLKWEYSLLFVDQTKSMLIMVNFSCFRRSNDWSEFRIYAFGYESASIKMCSYVIGICVPAEWAKERTMMNSAPHNSSDQSYVYIWTFFCFSNSIIQTFLFTRLYIHHFAAIALTQLTFERIYDWINKIKKLKASNKIVLIMIKIISIRVECRKQNE